MGLSPYVGLSPESFWRLGVAQQAPGALEGLYRRRFSLPGETRMAIAGGCFAQGFARVMLATAATVIDCNHGNIYFARQLRQLIEEAYGHRLPEDAVWERDGRYFDALRPSVEPDGLADRGEVLARRRLHLVTVREMFESADVFVYVFGLNEAWMHEPSGTVYPTAPGTVTGSYDPEIHRWHAFSYAEVYEDFKAFATMLREANPQIRFLTMVSPVPGTATLTDQHILAADTQHKAILRAAAGAISEELDFVAYFPAFELVATQFSRGEFYEGNRRTVSAAGYSTIIATFLDQHPELKGAGTDFGEDDGLCEDLLLEAFAP